MDTADDRVCSVFDAAVLRCDNTADVADDDGDEEGDALVILQMASIKAGLLYYIYCCYIVLCKDKTRIQARRRQDKQTKRDCPRAGWPGANRPFDAFMSLALG